MRTDLPAPAVSRLETVLDDEERQRAGTLGLPVDRCRYIAAHGAARRILAARLGVRPEEIRWRRGPHGKPELVDGPQVNLSHSGGLAALVVGGERPVGVDIEELSPRLRPARMAARFYPADEAAYVAESDSPADALDRFVRLWVRKEACVKAAGGRIFRGLSLPVRCDVVPGPFFLTDISVPDGFRAAVALTGDRPYRTVVRWWPGLTEPGREVGGRAG